MTSWHSYPKIYALGHSALEDLLKDPVIVEEKIDGSQFSFGKFDGKLKVRSKGCEMIPEAPEKMFQAAVDEVNKRFDLLQDGWTYRGEYLQKPKHNALAYDRIPQRHIIIFDINPSEEKYLPYDEKKDAAKELGFEVIPKLDVAEHAPDSYLSLLNNISVLGGQKIEGFVVKNYQRFGKDKKVLMGKFVSEAFKEVNKVNWRSENPKQNDIILTLKEKYRNQSRWNKGIQHLKEAGKLSESPKDIALILKEVSTDIRKECQDEIKQTLFDWAWPQIQRGCIKGLPEFYKEELLKRQFQ